jgi:hypothetical protein
MKRKDLTDYFGCSKKPKRGNQPARASLDIMQAVVGFYQ